MKLYGDLVWEYLAVRWRRSESDMAGSIVSEQTITGYILANKEDDDVENEDEEEEIQTEFLDMKEVKSVSSGGKVFKFSVPASKEGMGILGLLINRPTFKAAIAV